MAIYNPATQKVIVSAGDSDKPKYAVRAPRFLALALSYMGLLNVTIATTPPGDVRTLWYNKDTDTLRRYNPLTTAWANITPSQFFMHILQRAFRDANVEGVMADDDKVPFLDVSADEMKMISVADLKASLGVSGWVPWGATKTLLVDASEFPAFDLPTTFNDFLLVASYTPIGGGGSVAFGPRVIGVYPTNVDVDIIGEFTGGAGLAGTPTKRHWWFTGDRSDLTGIIWRQKPQGSGGAFPIIEGLTNRIAKVKFVVPNGNFVDWPSATYQFAAGSTLKLFVR